MSFELITGEMFKNARALAMQITEKTYDKPGTGYQYFRAEEGTKQHTGTVLAFLAIEFFEADSYFLAGPFKHEDKFYGLVVVTHNSNPSTQAQLVEHLTQITGKKESTTYMPWSASKRVSDYFDGKTTFWFDAQTKTSYSDLDLKMGRHEIPADVLSRLTKEGECAVFFRTKAALAFVENLLTANEIKAWEASLQSSQKAIIQESLQTDTFAEKPFCIRLQGTDDCSWTQNFATEKEVFEFLTSMQEKGSLCVKEMQFTN